MSFDWARYLSLAEELGRCKADNNDIYPGLLPEAQDSTATARALLASLRALGGSRA